MISIVMPVYNEERIIKDTLLSLEDVISGGDEIIVVDGGSGDRTADIINTFSGIKHYSSKRGRASQMNFGAEHCTNEYILFLHADTVIPEKSFEMLKSEVSSGTLNWGFFRIKLNCRGIKYRVMEYLATLKAFITNTPYGDHGIFVKKECFIKVGGYPEISLMEDICIVNKLRKISPGKRINSPVITSVRRFRDAGYFYTIFNMWMIKLLFRIGVSPKKLSEYYGNIR